MPEISRRHFNAALLALGAQLRSVWGAAAAGIDRTLRASLQRHKIPACVAMAATSGKTTYSGAFGKRDSASGVDVHADSLFTIASMTKPITSVAAMQLVEQGKLKLDEPASAYLQELGSLQVLDELVGEKLPSCPLGQAKGSLLGDRLLGGAAEQRRAILVGQLAGVVAPKLLLEFRDRPPRADDRCTQTCSHLLTLLESRSSNNYRKADAEGTRTIPTVGMDDLR